MVSLCFSGRGVGGVDDLSDVFPLNTLSRYNEALKKKRKRGEHSSYHSVTVPLQKPPEGRGQVMQAAYSVPRGVKESQGGPFSQSNPLLPDLKTN